MGYNTSETDVKRLHGGLEIKLHEGLEILLECFAIVAENNVIHGSQLGTTEEEVRRSLLQLQGGVEEMKNSLFSIMIQLKQIRFSTV